MTADSSPQDENLHDAAVAGGADGADGTDAADAADATPAGSAILRAIRVLETIAASPTPPQLVDLCKATRLPKPTVFRILSTLEYAGLVSREPGSKRYTCGQRLGELAGEVVLNSPSRGTRHAILEELVEQIGETCNLTIPNGSSVMYLDRVETAWPLRITLGAGSSVPLHASARGKLFLSHLPKQARERFIRQSPLIRHTQQTLTDAAALAAEFERIRRQGYATDNEEYLAGICCLAVPVHDAQARVVAALAMHAPVARMKLEQAMQFLPAMQAAAEAMRKTLEW
ncbi:MAG: IclR family transcriptional regulator [Burkholderiales bacterium]|nr:IclR family transcriptional regulator [Burkholderiales bacterium]